MKPPICPECQGSMVKKRARVRRYIRLNRYVRLIGALVMFIVAGAMILFIRPLVWRLTLITVTVGVVLFLDSRWFVSVCSQCGAMIPRSRTAMQKVWMVVFWLIILQTLFAALFILIWGEKKAAEQEVEREPASEGIGPPEAGKVQGIGY